MRARRTLFINNVNIYYFSKKSGVRLLSDVVGGLILSADDPLDLHDEI